MSTVEIRPTHVEVLRAMSNRDHFDFDRFMQDANSADKGALARAVANAPPPSVAQRAGTARPPLIAKSAAAQAAAANAPSVPPRTTMGGTPVRSSSAVSSDPILDRPTFVRDLTPEEEARQTRQKKMLLKYLRGMLHVKSNGKKEKMPVDMDNTLEEIREEIEHRKEIKRRGAAADAACDFLVLLTKGAEKINSHFMGNLLPINNLNKSMRASVPTRFRRIMPDVLDELFPNGGISISPTMQLALGVVAVAAEHVEGGLYAEDTTRPHQVRPHYNAGGGGGDDDDGDDDDDDDDDDDAELPMPENIGGGGGGVNRPSSAVHAYGGEGADDTDDDGLYGYGDQDTGGGGGGIAGGVAMVARYMSGEGF